MKKYFLLVMMILSISALAATVTADKVAAPVVASDPPQPDSYSCTFTPATGTPITKSILPIRNADGSVQLLAPLEPLLPAATYSCACASVKGATTTTATACSNQAVVTQTGVLKPPSNVVVQ